jgi:hypothetical protein
MHKEGGAWSEDVRANLLVEFFFNKDAIVKFRSRAARNNMLCFTGLSALAFLPSCLCMGPYCCAVWLCTAKLVRAEAEGVRIGLTNEELIYIADEHDTGVGCACQRAPLVVFKVAREQVVDARIDYAVSGGVGLSTVQVRIDSGPRRVLRGHGRRRHTETTTAPSSWPLPGFEDHEYVAKVINAWCKGEQLPEPENAKSATFYRQPIYPDESESDSDSSTNSDEKKKKKKDKGAKKSETAAETHAASAPSESESKSNDKGDAGEGDGDGVETPQ